MSDDTPPIEPPDVDTPPPKNSSGLGSLFAGATPGNTKQQPPAASNPGPTRLVDCGVQGCDHTSHGGFSADDGARSEPPKADSSRAGTAASGASTNSSATPEAVSASDKAHTLLSAAFTRYNAHNRNNLGALHCEIEGLEEALKEHAKSGDPVMRRLHNAVSGIMHELEEFAEHDHGHSNDKRERLDAVQQKVQDLFAKRHSLTPEALVNDLEAIAKRHDIKVPGLLIRAADLPMHKEYSAQVKEHMASKGLFGKAMAFACSSVSLGVIAHGGLNIKRGLMGYRDNESGEQKPGALSTLVVGTLEVAAGMFALKKSLTGRFSFGRATHAAHDHHHGHGHDHSHGHGHGH